jgi:DNA-binding FrmR family transcriptional regulator
MRNNPESKIQNSKLQTDTIKTRLNRVGGQIEGIKKMYEDENCDCISVVIQIQAARAALGRVAGIMLNDEAQRCVDKGDIKKLKEVVASTYKSI